MAVYGPPNSEELYHYGTKRHSGRYPYGSGENPYQSEPSKRKTYGKLGTIEKLKLKHKQKAATKKKAKDAKEAKTAAKKAEEEKATNMKKPEAERVKTMTDEEVVNAINRLRLEQTYLSLIQQTSSQNKPQQPQQQSQLTPSSKQIEKGKSWLDETINKTKKLSDLANNISGIAKGVNGAYANINAIIKAMNAAEEAAKNKTK